MKFVLLIYQAEDYDPKSLSPEAHQAVAAGYAAVSGTPNVRSGLPLGFAHEAITVRLHEGRTVTSERPFIEQPGGTVGGYLEFEAESLEDAVRLAAQVPAVQQGGAVEIRPSRVYW